ncbi:unnamed protein product [Adineta steineri]|uniref:Tetratricopeptide repeat protein n=1 Tax=Adineta steineri TaxID=433720 RepID=A0A815GKG8_9BILA|nr:unnamed protein product [Adineta steineri]
MTTNEYDYQTLLAKTENEELEQLASVYHQLACLSFNSNRAISFYKRSIEINLYYRPTDYDLLSTSYNNLGALLNKHSDYNQALKYYRCALNTDLREPEINQLKIATCYNNIGNILKKQGNYPEANKHFRQALTIQLKNVSFNDLILITTYHNLGSVYCLMKDYPLAIEYYEKSVKILEEFHPLQYSLMAYTYNKIGSVYNLMKNYAVAFSCQKKALKMQEKCISSDNPSLATRHFNMAIALEGLKRFEEAVDHVTQAIEILRKTLGPHQRKIRHYQKYLDKLRQKL